HRASSLRLRHSLHALVTFYLHHPAPPPDVYTLSLHDALPIYTGRQPGRPPTYIVIDTDAEQAFWLAAGQARTPARRRCRSRCRRSEEHTSELQSPCNLVCRLLPVKKKQTNERNQPNGLVVYCY